VYTGPGESAADRQENGWYWSGDERPVKCHTLGRLVVSHPEVGETPNRSQDWYLLDGPEPQYATGTYGTIIPPGAAVPECPPR
jgi:hypothetical protein